MAVVEVEAEAGCAQCGGLLTKPGQRFCSFVCEATANGHASNLRSRQGTNGKLPEPEDETESRIPIRENVSPPPAVAEAAPAQVCALDGCAAPVTGRQALYCSKAHQRRAGHQRASARETLATTMVGGSPPELVPEPEGLARPPFAVRDDPEALPGPLEQMASVAALLPPGWRLEATSASVSVSVSLA
jgi:hypothetical protein